MRYSIIQYHTLIPRVAVSCFMYIAFAGEYGVSYYDTYHTYLMYYRQEY